MGSKAFFKGRAGKRKFATVTIDGQLIRVRSLTLTERAAINRRWLNEDGTPTRDDRDEALAALFCVMSIVDDRGNLEWTDEEEDLQVFINGQSDDMQLMDRSLTKLNYHTTEELEKNFGLEATPAS